MRIQVRSLASLSELRIQRCQELWCRSQMRLGSGVAVAVDLVLLWLWIWCRLAVVPPIQPLAWELPYAMGVALKSKKEKAERQRN